MTAVQQSAAPHPAVRQRIDWIDTAKGLCMILVIVGHTLPYGNLMRNFIFSFHMPAFFFLTGYTARRPDTWQGFARRVRKDFVALIVPVLGVVLMQCGIAWVVAFAVHCVGVLLGLA